MTPAFFQALVVKKIRSIVASVSQVSVPVESPTAIVPEVSPIAECASSRSTRYSGPICHRVGCYEPPRVTHLGDAIAIQGNSFRMKGSNRDE